MLPEIAEPASPRVTLSEGDESLLRVASRAAFVTLTGLSIAELIYVTLFWQYRVVEGPREVYYNPEMTIPLWKYWVSWAPVLGFQILLGFNTRRLELLLPQAAVALVTLVLARWVAYLIGDMGLGLQPDVPFVVTTFVRILLISAGILVLRRFIAPARWQTRVSQAWLDPQRLVRSVLGGGTLLTVGLALLQVRTIAYWEIAVLTALGMALGFTGWTAVQDRARHNGAF